MNNGVNNGVNNGMDDGVYTGQNNGNPYEQVTWAYQTPVEPPKKKKNRIPGIVLMIMGAVFLLMGGLAVVGGIGIEAVHGSTEGAQDLYWAEESGEFCAVDVQYMTEYVACYTDEEETKFYIVCDKDWNPAVICVEDADIEKFQPYIDWLYSESYDNEPEQLSVAGYSQPFEAELQQFVIEEFSNAFGEDIVDESNFSDWFGDYYLVVGAEKLLTQGAFIIGTILLVLAAVLLILGIILFCVVPASEPKRNNLY